MAICAWAVVAFVLLSCTSSPKSFSPRFIAEWETHKEVWIGFRTLELDSMYDYVSLRVIRNLVQHVHTKVVVEDSLLLPEGKQFFVDNGIDTSNLEIVYETPTYYWLRDPAPIFYENASGAITVADFRFNNYVNIPFDSLDKDELIFDGYDRLFASQSNFPVISSPLVLEGGAFETNGKGTLILVESVVLNRNPEWTKSQIEQELNQKFNVKTIIWLPNGLAEDPYYMGHLYKDYFGFGTGGHSDEFVRFVNDTTVLLAWEFSEPDTAFPLREMNILRMQINKDILENARDWRGRKFHVVKVPIPVIFYKVVDLDQGTYDYLKNEDPLLDISPNQQIKIVACAGYLNYLITNEIVIIPKYWTPNVPVIQRKKDSLAKSIFQEFYPDREIIQINPLVLNYGGGGMHCTYFATPSL